MARPSKEILRTLSSAHLRAIGRVATQWNALELTVLWVLSKVAGSGLTTTVVLAGSQNATAWAEMLQKLTRDTKAITGSKTELDRIRTRIEEAQRKRNDVVHAAWHPRAEVRGIIAEAMIQPKPKAGDRVTATALPKRGKEIYKDIAYTSAEMLKVADEIQATESDLFDWFARWQRSPRGLLSLQPPVGPAQPNRLAEVLLQPSTRQFGLGGGLSGGLLGSHYARE